MRNVFKEKIDNFVEYIKKNPSVIAVYVFGSYADDTFGEKSDIDLAILYDKPYPIEEHLKDSVEVERIFDNTPVDYIRFEEISIFFQFKILRNGKLIYHTDEEKLSHFIQHVQRNYIEMIDSRKKYEEYVLNHSSLGEEEWKKIE